MELTQNDLCGLGLGLGLYESDHQQHIFLVSQSMGDLEGWYGLQ